MVLTISVILAIYLTHISAEDIRTREISNFAPFIIIAASPFLNELSLSARITGLLALFITLFAANLIADIGMGDVKLCAAFGFALGAVPEFIAVLLALISAKKCRLHRLFALLMRLFFYWRFFSMLKNRTLIGIILIVLAIILCFGITPLFSAVLEQKTTVIKLKEDIPQGAQIQPSMLAAVEVGTLNLPDNIITDPEQIVGKYTVAAMFAGDTFSANKLSDTIDTSDTLLRQLGVNETAMSVTVRSFANGLSGKLQTGDVIQIISVNEDKDDEAIIYDELQYVEVLATTADNGSDDTYNADEVNAVQDDDEEQALYATITVICQDRAQALKLAECENTTLHAVFVCRGDSEHKAEYLAAQRELLGVVDYETAEAVYDTAEIFDESAESEVE